MKRRVIAVDPSGNYKEGKGVTGYAVYDCDENKIIHTLQVEAKKWDNRQSYWLNCSSALRYLMDAYETNTVVLEDYRLYGHKAKSQTNSELETPRLLGFLEMVLWARGVQPHYQMAAAVKKRWSDEILEEEELLTEELKTYSNRHCRDAIRHAVHYGTFNMGSDDND